MRLSNALHHLFAFGNYGVDIFLFLSGLGMSYSLSHSHKLWNWYKKRYVRILVPYAISFILFYILRIIYTDSYSVMDFVLGITTFDYWIYHKGAWFVALLLPLYLLTPFIAKSIDGNGKNRLVIATIFCLFFTFVSSPVISFENTYSRIWEDNIQWAIQRVPLYIIGYYVAPMIFASKQINVFHVLLVVCVSILGMKALGFNWILAIPILLLIGYLLPYLLTLRFINQTLCFMGKISLESYLANISLGSLLQTINLPFHDEGNYIKYSIVIIGGILLAVIVNKISERMIVELQR